MAFQPPPRQVPISVLYNTEVGHSPADHAMGTLSGCRCWFCWNHPSPAGPSPERIQHWIILDPRFKHVKTFHEISWQMHIWYIYIYIHVFWLAYGIICYLNTWVHQLLSPEAQITMLEIRQNNAMTLPRGQAWRSFLRSCKTWTVADIFTLWWTNIAMENHHF